MTLSYFKNRTYFLKDEKNVYRAHTVKIHDHANKRN